MRKPFSAFQKYYFAIIMALLSVGYASAQTWTDVTSEIMTNPNMEWGNTQGWDLSVNNAQNIGYQSHWYSNGEVWIARFAEAWIPSGKGTLGDGHISQSTKLQSGKYRLEADCIAVRQEGYGTNPVAGVYLFAKLEDGTVYKTDVHTNDGKPEHFTVEFEVSQAGYVEYGLLLESPTANWVAVDNFLMYLSGDTTPLQSASFAPSSMNLSLDEVQNIAVNYTPANATFINFGFVSSNTSVAYVDRLGNVTGKDGGDAIIEVQDYAGNTIGEIPVHVSLPEVYPDAIVINEIQSCNLDMFLDPSMNYGSWIEIYNPTDRATGLGGLYISDTASNLKKWRLQGRFGSVPAHGYRNIWFDHYGIWKEGELKQVNFKLDYEGGTIIISDGEKIIAQQNYPQGISRTSYARKVDGGSEWALSGNPTPEATNSSMTFAQTQLSAPNVDKDGSVFTSGGFNINVDVPSGAQLRYTTDGSTPTESSTLATSNQFYVDGSVVYRFRLFQDGYLPSEVVTRSYIQDDSNNPIISVVTDNDNIYSSESGLFEKGPNGRPGNGQDTNCNWNMDWDRPVNFEYFDENHEYALNQEVDMSMCGGWSRANSPHSFKLKAGKYYAGKNSMDYQFFEGKPFLKHKVLQIRNGGSGNRLRDSSLQEIMRRSGLYIDTQSWKPVRVYINGSHYADLNMREPNNKHFAYANYGIDTDYMDQFEMSPDSGYVQMAGTKDSFNRLLELSTNASNENTYEEIKKLLDIDEYINYMAAELYLGNWDWPQNNVKGFRDQNNGKFHFVVYDLDGAFSQNIDSFFDKNYKWFDTLRGEDALGHSLWGTQKYEEIEFVTLFINMLQNDKFQKQFVDAMSIVGGSVFDYDYAYGIIEEMGNAMGEGNVWSVANNLSGRQSNMANQLKNNGYFNLSEIIPQQTSLSSNVDGAQILINGIPVPTGKFNGYLFAPATIKASAPAGYVFKGWKSNAPQSISDAEDVFTNESEWYYDDTNTSMEGTDWKTTLLSKSGTSPIGYDSNGSKYLNTSTSQNNLTYYFNKTFTIPDDVNSGDVFTLNYIIDDGMVVYINGEEAGRYNMPSGTIGHDTAAATYANDNPDSGSMIISSSYFKKGTNYIAVEVHNNQTSSSDIYWEASLSRAKASESTSAYFTTDTSFSLPSGNYSYEACFEKIADYELANNGVKPIKVNELSASNDMYVNDHFKKDDWIELYNTTDDEIDIAGMYISDNETDPQKFQIPANDIQNTVIAPHSHLVLWASNRNNIGEQIHANFKLSNSNGSVVMLTSQDGEWSDKLTYSTHGTKETVGVYPDGGRNVYHMYRPTIGGDNTLTSYAQFLYDNSPLADADKTFTLSLSEGWNWISHPLENNLNVSNINRNAYRILSQTSEKINDPVLGWKGNLTSLSPTAGYKVKMNADDEFSFDGPFFADGNTISLRKGWNWIGYPVVGNQLLTVALSRFSASEGDQIIGQYGFATYENGEWSGSLEALATGSGYLYKSATPKSLKYSSPTSAPSDAKPRFLVQPLTAWTATPTAHPNVMGIVAKMVVDGEEAESGLYSVGAFSEDGECRGIGKYVNGTLYITVYGEGNEDITFRAADSQTGIVYDITDMLYFTEEVKGTRKSPIVLHIGEATDIARTKTNSSIESISFFTLDGIYAGSNKSSLSKGVYIEKIALKTGGNITKKVILK